MGFDLMQMFTPPKSKTPWTAMTEGATHKNTQLEKWGPAINSIASVIGNMIYPGAGSIGGGIGGIIGMQGRDSGFQGTDKGWGNIAPVISGYMKGSNAGTPMGIFNNFRSTGGSYIDGGNSIVGGYNTNPPNTKYGEKNDFMKSLLTQIIGIYLNRGGGSNLSMARTVGR